jgi:ankyrin repeat protein
MLKKYYAIILLLHCSSVIKPEETVATTEKKQETQEVQIYASPSIETLQADKEFCLKTLSDETADINALSPSGKTTLQLLTLYFINNFSTEKLMARALKRGADANVRDEQERTPLFFVAAYALCPEVFAEKQKTLDNFLEAEKNAIEDSATKITRNPLHNRTLSLAVVELLLAFNADPTVTDADGISPLLLAVSTGDQEIVELFARYGLMEKIFQAEDARELSKENSDKETVIAQ